MFFKSRKNKNTEVENQEIKEIEKTQDLEETISLVNSPDKLSKGLKWRLYLTGYGYAICSFIAVFFIGFCTNIFTGVLNVAQKYNYLEETQAFGTLDNLWNESDSENAEEIKEEKNTSSLINSHIISKGNSNSLLLADNTPKQDTYRFIFKNKNFPKIASSYPVYRATGAFMKNKSKLKNLNSLKIGTVDFSKFEDLTLSHFGLYQTSETGYQITYNRYDDNISIFLSSNGILTGYEGEVPSDKQIIKTVESNLKELGIKLDQYGDGIVKHDEEIIDAGDIKIIGAYESDLKSGLVTVFYPLIINGKDVYYHVVDEYEQDGLYIVYDLNNKRIHSIGGLDVASFEVSDYQSNDIDEISENVAKGGTYFEQSALHENSINIQLSNIKVVYEKLYNKSDSTWYYAPVVMGEVKTAIEDYSGPKYILQSII